MNINLRQGGRTAVKMSMEDFKTKIEKAIKKFDIRYDMSNMYMVVKEMMYTVPTIIRDMKVDLNMENMEIEFTMTSTGVPYLFIECASDCSPWMVMMIYHDGKNLRAYVPTLGNPYNRDTKLMLGEFLEDDIEFLKSELGEQKLIELVKQCRSQYEDVYDMEDDNEEITIDEDCMYEIVQMLEYDRESVIKDFETRVIVK